MEKIIRDTTLARRFAALDAVYARVETDQAEFRATAAGRGLPVACPPRCGTCCLHFVPDAVPIEADRLAYFLLTEKPQLIDLFFDRRKEAARIDAACPFWNPDRPGENCMVYPGRPLICRLFGFCSIFDKHGEPTFALCRQMPPLPGFAERRFTGASRLVDLFGAVPPPMADLAREVAALDPTEAGERSGIDEALPPALARVSLALKLAAAESAGEDRG